MRKNKRQRNESPRLIRLKGPTDKSVRARISSERHPPKLADDEFGIYIAAVDTSHIYDDYNNKLKDDLFMMWKTKLDENELPLYRLNSVENQHHRHTEFFKKIFEDNEQIIESDALNLPITHMYKVGCYHSDNSIDRYSLKGNPLRNGLNVSYYWPFVYKIKINNDEKKIMLGENWKTYFSKLPKRERSILKNNSMRKLENKVHEIIFKNGYMPNKIDDETKRLVNCEWVFNISSIKLNVLIKSILAIFGRDVNECINCIAPVNTDNNNNSNTNTDNTKLKF